MNSSAERETKLSLFEQASQKYPGIDLASNLLTDEVLIEVLFDGVVRESSIRQCLDQSGHFVDASQVASWRIVWQWREMPEEAFNSGFARMEEEFRSRKFKIPGEIKHVVGLRLWASSIGLIDISRVEVSREAEVYVDDLLSRGDLPPLLEDTEDDDFHDAYGNLGFAQAESLEFRGFLNFLHKKRIEAGKLSYPRLANNLIDDMRSDASLFYRRLNATNSDDNIYYRVPLLSKLDVERFSRVFFELNPSSQRTVLRAFASRYEHPERSDLLEAEKEVLKALHKRLQEYALGAPLIIRQRLLESLEPAFRAILTDAMNTSDT